MNNLVHFKYICTIVQTALLSSYKTSPQKQTSFPLGSYFEILFNMAWTGR